MKPHRPKGQASLFDLGCTKRKRTEDDVPARELIIRLRPDVQQAVAARDAAIAANIASRPAPVKVLEAQGACTIGGASPSRREACVRAATQVEWGGASGALASALHSKSSSRSRVGPGSCGGRGSRGGRTHSARARGRGRGRGLETLEISETTTEEDEGEEEGAEAMQE